MSIMYSFTRQEVAESLGISTRSVDRYIKAGKLRSKKEGKIVYVNDEDVKNLSGDTDKKQEIIIKNNYKKEEGKKEEIKKEKYEVLENSQEDKNQKKHIEIKEIEVKSNFKTFALDKVYDDLRAEVKQKDEVIQDLAIKLGRAEEIVKNSVSMIDFKRSQMLLEDSKTHLGSAISELKNKNDVLEKKLVSDKKTILILFVSVVILLAIAVVTWFLSI